MRILPFTVGTLRLSHPGVSEPLGLQANDFMRDTSAEVMQAKYGQRIKWCAIDPGDVHVLLAVTERGQFVGAIGLFFLKPLADDPLEVVCGQFAPCMPEVRANPASWNLIRTIAQYLVDNPLPLEGGGALDIVKLDLPDEINWGERGKTDRDQIAVKIPSDGANLERRHPTVSR